MPIRRKKYKHKKRIRSSTRSAIVIGLSVIILVVIIQLISNNKSNRITKEEVVFYKSMQEFKQDYDVLMKTNKYMNVEDLKENQPFVTDLIENLIVYFNYRYQGQNAKKINVTYNVYGILKSSYSSEGKEEEIWNKKYVLLEDKEISSENNELEINENVEIDLPMYNSLVKEFIEEMEIAINSKMSIIFEANVTAYVEDEMVIDHYSNEMQVTIGDKVTKISNIKEEKIPNSKTKTKENIINSNSHNNVIYITILFIAVYWIIKIQKDTKPFNRVISPFKEELNQIFNEYSDKIIKVYSKNNFIDSKITEVRDINELLKLSEETIKPILCYQSREKQEAWFYIVSDNEVYRYILKK